MMQRRALMLGVIATVALLGAGCASGPKYADMKAKIPVLKSGEGRIYVLRDSVYGAAIQPKVYLNGVEVGTAQAKGFFFLDRPAGNYTINSTTEVERSMTFVLAAGEIKYVRAVMGMGFIAGRMTYELIPAAEGQQALEGLSYTGK